MCAWFVVQLFLHLILKFATPFENVCIWPHAFLLDYIKRGRSICNLYGKIGNYVVKEWDMIHRVKEEKNNSKYANIEKYWK